MGRQGVQQKKIWRRWWVMIMKTMTVWHDRCLLMIYVVFSLELAQMMKWLQKQGPRMLLPLVFNPQHDLQYHWSSLLAKHQLGQKIHINTLFTQDKNHKCTMRWHFSCWYHGICHEATTGMPEGARKGGKIEGSGSKYEAEVQLTCLEWWDESRDADEKVKHINTEWEDDDDNNYSRKWVCHYCCPSDS